MEGFLRTSTNVESRCMSVLNILEVRGEGGGDMRSSRRISPAEKISDLVE